MSETTPVDMDTLRRLKLYAHTRAKLVEQDEALDREEEDLKERRRRLDAKVDAWCARNDAADREESELEWALRGTEIDVGRLCDALLDWPVVMTDDDLAEALAQHLDDDGEGEE